ncbi:AAA family ATPase [Acinetobacter nosocomialis]|uniref:AbiJ-related protein n=1 Tax=Acinetobacter nosocomialis TaxID=106654 RepID=UPI001B82BD0E|nr:AAA family ATPase [Acinetobacter nosocomialis]MBR7716770.1 AAA family ATPase [Acinetobacter nosocomialis]
MFDISLKTKKDIINILVSKENLFGKLSDLEVLEFFDSILDLKSLPTTDHRKTQYPTAYEDFYQHYVNNNDWDNNELLKIKFNFTNDNGNFIKFITKIISPQVRASNEEIIEYCNLIEDLTKKENLIFQVWDYEPTTKLPIYRLVQNSESKDYIRNIPQNKMLFHVNNVTIEYQKIDYPCFILSNINFNDFGNYSNFFLDYFPEKDNKIHIGRLKIIKKNDFNTIQVIPHTFTELDDYCSIGEDMSYYEKFKEIFGDLFYSKLRALKDCSFFHDTLEFFENDDNFKKSIIRDNEQERLIRRAKLKINNYDLDNLYKFTYKFKPKYDENFTDIEFDFDETSWLSNRIITLIGKNGCGKTQLLSKLPIELSQKKQDFFYPKIPQFGKIISVSYSIFDNFTLPRSNFDFNYINCSLRDDSGKLLTKEDLTIRLIQSCKKIQETNRTRKWLKTISTFLDEDIVENLISENDSHIKNINLTKISDTLKILSSGQNILLNIITEIIKNIRYDSLIIYDEPETHLHPNAISQLTNTLYTLTEEFESFCLIATHSPLVVQEMLAKNVYILEKEQNNLYVRKPNSETFGENLTVITNEIFGNRDVPDYFKIQLKRLVSLGLSYDSILQEIQSPNTEVSLNVNLYLKSLFNEKFKK